MTTDKIIALAKEKLGKDITEQEAQDYISGKIAIPDEALEIVSGGSSCILEELKCPKCDSRDCISKDVSMNTFRCCSCGHIF